MQCRILVDKQTQRNDVIITEADITYDYAAVVNMEVIS